MVNASDELAIDLHHVEKIYRRKVHALRGVGMQFDLARLEDRAHVGHRKRLAIPATTALRQFRREIAANPDPAAELAIERRVLVGRNRLVQIDRADHQDRDSRLFF